MEIITGDRLLPEPFFLDGEEEMMGFPEVAVIPTATDAAAVNFASSESAAEIMTMMMNPPPPAKKLRPIRRSPEPFAQKPQGLSINDQQTGFLVFNPADVNPTRTEFSSSSDDEEYDSSMCVRESKNGKRKGNSRKKIEHFLENMVRKVMQKQEEMHQQLIDMIEQRENERIMKEEEWKRQEMERIRKDEEMRAYEISRSRALIAQIQSVLGTEVEIPQPSTDSRKSYFSMERPKVEDIQSIQSILDIEGSKAIIPFTSDQMNKRWPDTEVQALIKLRTSLDHKFRYMGSKLSIWDEISAGMGNIGYNRTAKKCKEKWENINKYFRRSIENGKKPHENGKTCPYFHELNVLYKNGFFNSGIH